MEAIRVVEATEVFANHHNAEPCNGSGLTVGGHRPTIRYNALDNVVNLT
jgi:hypothetical protein